MEDLAPSGSFFNSWKKYSRTQIVFLIVIFCVFLYYRLAYRIASAKYVGDEFFTIQNLNYPWHTYFFKILPSMEYHYPGTYLLIYPLGQLSTNPYFLFLPFLAISVAFYLLLAKIDWWRLFNFKQEVSVFPQWINVIACGLIAVNQTQHIHSFEMRPYSTLSLLALLALWCTWVIFHGRSFKWRYVFGLSAILLFHNFGILMIFLSAFYLTVYFFLGSNPKNRFKNIVKRLKIPFQTIVVASLISFPLIFFYFQGGHSHLLNTGLAKKSEKLVNFDRNTHEFIQQGWRGFEQVAALCYGFSGKQRMLRGYVVALMFLGSLVIIFKKHWAALSFLVIFVATPLIVIYLSALYSGYWFIQRQFVWVMPFWALYNAFCIVLVAREFWPRLRERIGLTGRRANQ